MENYQRHYRELARQLADIGDIAAGSLAPRYNRCGRPSCGCHANPLRLHGSYHLWHKGQRLNRERRLSEGEAALYNKWVGNDRQVRAPLNMCELAAKHINSSCNWPNATQRGLVAS